MAPLLWTTLFSPALAQQNAVTAYRPRPVAGHPVLEMRVGADRANPQHPYLCGELIPLAALSLEGCGTGAGFLHQDNDSIDMAHFRARLRALSVSRGRTSADLLLGGGFAEVQRTVDEAGFRFGRARSADQVEAAGPEASISIKGRYWVDRGGRAFATADLNAGVANIPAAPTVFDGGGPWIPFAALTIGMGF